MKLAVVGSPDQVYTELIDEDTGESIVKFNYDDGAEKGADHVVTVLAHLGIKVERKDV